jgi:hypothetical protein
VTVPSSLKAAAERVWSALVLNHWWPSSAELDNLRAALDREQILVAAGTPTRSCGCATCEALNAVGGGDR